MPRAERPLDVGEDDVLGQFAAGLRELRERAGSPPYRALARKAHYSAATLSEAAAGRKLPGLAVTLAYVGACGGDTGEWEQRWHAVAADRASTDRPGAAAGSADSATDGPRSPYVGLAPFQPEDTERFHGREALTEDLLRRVGNDRFVAVFGASGAGKSSLLRAGIVSRLRQPDQGPGHGSVVLFTPGPHPIQECAVALGELAGLAPTTLAVEFRADPDALHLCVRQALHGLPAEADVVLVVDQFEEVFTLCEDPEERAAFINALISAAGAANSRTRVILGVRLDFYDHCAAFPDLATELRDGQLLVGPMNTDELQAAITQPAARTGYKLERALLAEIIADTVGQPGVLPLLSHALAETWRRRRGTTLTLAGYHAAGGIAHAVAHTADAVYTDLDEAQQRVAQDLFLRLTALGDGTDDTGRRVYHGELDSDEPDQALVIERLVRARLIMVDGDGIAIAHEALIRHWPRLRAWLSTDRDALRVHRQLTEATDAWESLDHDDGALYRGTRLVIAEDWLSDNDHRLAGRERSFLTASFAAETEERASTLRRTHTLRRLLVVLSVLLLASITTTWYAVTARQSAIAAQNTATRQRDIAAAEYADSKVPGLLANNDIPLALDVLVTAYHLDPAADTRSALLSGVASSVLATNSPRTVATVTSQPTISPLINGHDFGGLTAIEVPGLGSTGLVGLQGKFGATTKMWGFAASADSAAETGQYEFGGDNTSAGYIDTSTAMADPKVPVTTGYGAAYDSRTHVLGVNSRGTGQLWDIADPSAPTLLSVLPGAEQVLAFSPDGRTLATLADQQTWSDGTFATPGGGVRTAYDDSGPPELWDVTNPRQPHELANLDQIEGANQFQMGDVVFSPAGNRLATVDPGGAISLWNVTEPARPRLLANLGDDPPLGGIPQTAASVAFSPDGSKLISVSESDAVEVWDLTDPHYRKVQAQWTDAGNGPDAFALSPDGRYLAVQTDEGIDAADNVLQIWDLAGSGKPVTISELSTPAIPVTFAPDGHTLIAIDPGGLVIPVETDVDSAIGQACHTIDGSVAFRIGLLEDEFWDTYFPGVPRQSVCVSPR